MRRWLLGLSLVGLMGCAASTPPVSAPMAEDLLGWTAPTPAPVPEIPPSREWERPPLPNEKVYPFELGQEYKVDVGLNGPLDVVFEPGEMLRDLAGPLEEDEQRVWHIKEGTSGSGADSRGHVFITASQPGKTMGLVITTNRRTRYLTVRSVQATKIRAVRWTYADTPPVTPTKLSLLPESSQSARYHVGYLIEPSQPRPVWTPRQVVDDGRKSYVLFPPTMLAGQAPMVRLIGPQGPQIVISRQVSSVIILDQVFDRAELRLGTGPTAETVLITRQIPVTIDCPGHADCPIWPSDYVGRP